VEVELDIEVAGLAAPGARMAVYFVGRATSNQWVDVLSAAINDTTNNPSVLSISWDIAEDAVPDQFKNAVDLALAAAGGIGITVLIASGDNGSQGSWGTQAPPDARAHVNFPPSSWNATGVGGTVLVPDGSGGVSREVAWNNGATTSASGGGVSTFFHVPPFQSAEGLNPASANAPHDPGRGVPDVSANADNYQVFVRGESVSLSGTSAATPLWAALISRINQGTGRKAGLLNQMLYGPLRAAGALNDVTTGDNGAYSAGAGWDACTGLGSPDGTAILLGLRAAWQVAPAVTRLSESAGNPGDQLVIGGTGFLGATTVHFGAVAAEVSGASIDNDTQLTVAVPAGLAPGTTVDVTVTAPGGTSPGVSASQFTFG
jgi:kumamolisin